MCQKRPQTSRSSTHLLLRNAALVSVDIFSALFKYQDFTYLYLECVFLLHTVGKFMQIQQLRLCLYRSSHLSCLPCLGLNSTEVLPGCV